MSHPSHSHPQPQSAQEVKLHPELYLHPLDWHSKRTDGYPTGSGTKWAKLKKEAEDKKLDVTFAETEKDLEQMWTAPCEAIFGTAIAETCGFCIQWMPDFMKMLPSADWRPVDEMKMPLVESRRVRFLVLDKYFKATEVFGRYAGDDLTRRAHNSHPTIFLLTGSPTGSKDMRKVLHIFLRLGTYSAADFPAGLTQDAFILGQMEAKLPGILKSPFFTYMSEATLTMAKTVSTWDPLKWNDVYTKSFPPKPQQGVQQSQATHVGVIAPPVPTIPVPAHLQKPPEMKVFFDGSLSREDGVQALYVGETLSLTWIYWQNPDQLMTPTSATCWQKMNNLRRSFGIPFVEMVSQSLIQTPTVELIQRDLKTGYAHTLRWRATEALNYLAGLEANLISEGVIQQQKQEQLALSTMTSKAPAGAAAGVAAAPARTNGHSAASILMSGMTG